MMLEQKGDKEDESHGCQVAIACAEQRRTRRLTGQWKDCKLGTDRLTQGLQAKRAESCRLWRAGRNGQEGGWADIANAWSKGRTPLLLHEFDALWQEEEDTTNNGRGVAPV